MNIPNSYAKAVAADIKAEIKKSEMQTTTTIICNKTLIFGDGSESFTKGKEYQVSNYPLATETNEYMVTIDNQGEIHKLGSWYKHFKIKK